MGRGGHRHLHHRHGGDVAAAGPPDAAPGPAPGPATGLRAGCGGGRGGRPGGQTGILPLFLVGLFVFGNGQASNLLARYAATDLAEPDERGRAMSRIVFASTFGAVFGPLLIGPAEHAGENWFGLEKYTGPWWFSSCFFLVAMVNTAVRLRPDPLVVTGGTTRDGNVVAKIRAREALALIMSFPRARLALAAMVISQGAMVGVMAMTPVHLKLHGHEAVSQYVVSTHIAGMYAFSPLVGRYKRREGSAARHPPGGRDPDGLHHPGRPVGRRGTAPVPLPVGAGPGVELRSHRWLQPPGRQHPD